MEGRRKFEVVSLDFGGTLAYDVKGDYVVYQEILGELGHDVQLCKLEEAVKSALDWWRGEKARTGILWDEETDVIWFERMLNSLTLPNSRHIAAKMAELWPLRVRYRAYDEVGLTLAELKRMGLRLIMISNVPSLRILSILVGQTGLRSFFDLLVASGTVGYEKPDQRIFELASHMANVRIERMVHVGNNREEDYLGARAAGMGSVLIDRTGVYGDVECGKISTLFELLGLLDRISDLN